MTLNKMNKMNIYVRICHDFCVSGEIQILVEKWCESIGPASETLMIGALYLFFCRLSFFITCKYWGRTHVFPEF